LERAAVLASFMTNINEIPAVLVFVGEYKQAASKVVLALCIGPGLCRIVDMDVREFHFWVVE
jgi:hypothetical protein